MRITVFTSDRPRHIALINRLSKVAQSVFVVQECDTAFSKKAKNFFEKSEAIRKYFSKLEEAENRVFGDVRLVSGNVTRLTIKTGDLNAVDLNLLEPCFQSDVFLVFEASYIVSPLVDILIEKKAVNVHMGILPYYSGSLSNFWALRDGNPDLVGATVHMIEKRLDSGSILYHAFPPTKNVDSFLLQMLAVKSVHKSIAKYIQENKLMKFNPAKQNKGNKIRYTRNKDFTGEVAGEYLKRLPLPTFIERKCSERDADIFINPYIYS